MGVVITLSGGFGSRRSKLAEKLEERLGYPRVKFSDYIKDMIAEDGENQADRLLQQQYGQKLVQNQLDGFVAGVLDRSPGWRDNGNLIVDGLRHVEVLLTLRRQIGPSTLFYVHVKADPLRREEAAIERGIPEQNMFRYDRALSEAQMNRILPAYANMEVEGSLGFSINVDEIVQHISGLQPPAQV